MLVDVPRLITDYFMLRPDPSDSAQRVAFGTSGHRGTSSEGTFNEAHVAAISQAAPDYRAQRGVSFHLSSSRLAVRSCPTAAVLLAGYYPPARSSRELRPSPP